MTEKTLNPGWRLVRFGDVVRQCKEKADPETSKLERYVAGDHMNTDDLRIRRWGEIGSGYLGPAFHMRFRPGQVLYGSRRTYLRKVAVADFDGICANTTFVLEPMNAEELIPEFLPFLMQTDAFNEFSVKNSKGSVNPYINFSDLSRFEFSLPSLKEQQIIAQSLSRADDMVQALQDAERAAKNVFESVAYEYFESNSDKWPRKRLEEVSLLMTNGFVGKSAQHYVTERGVPYLVSKNVRRNKFKLEELTYISEEFHRSARKSQLVEGDILTVQSGHIGETAVVPKEFVGANCHALIITRPDPKQLDSYFASYYLNSSIGQRRLSQLVIGSTIQHLNTSDLKKLEIPKPTIEEQKNIATLLSSISNDREMLTTRVEDAKRLRLQLLAEVFQ